MRLYRIFYDVGAILWFFSPVSSLSLHNSNITGGMLEIIFYTHAHAKTKRKTVRRPKKLSSDTRVTHDFGVKYSVQYHQIFVGILSYDQNIRLRETFSFYPLFYS